MVCTPDGNNSFFDIVTRVLLGDTLVPYLFIICQNYVFWILLDLIKENRFMLKKQEADDILQKQTTWMI